MSDGEIIITEECVMLPHIAICGVCRKYLGQCSYHASFLCNECNDEMQKFAESAIKIMESQGQKCETACDATDETSEITVDIHTHNSSAYNLSMEQARSRNDDFMKEVHHRLDDKRRE